MEGESEVKSRCHPARSEAPALAIYAACSPIYTNYTSVFTDPVTRVLYSINKFEVDAPISRWQELLTAANRQDKIECKGDYYNDTGTALEDYYSPGNYGGCAGIRSRAGLLGQQLH